MGVFELLVVVLLVLWLTGAFVFPVVGSAVHVLLVIVLILVMVRLFRNGKVL